MRTIIALFALLMLGMPLPAADSPDTVLGELPKEIAQLRRDGVSKYDEAGLGASTSYKRPGLLVTVYMYDLGVSEIGNDLTDPTLQKAFGMAKGDIDGAAKKGYYSSVEKAEDGTVKFENGATCLRARYHLVRTDKTPDKNLRIISEVYVFGARGHIIKLRVSGQATHVGENEKALKVLVPTLYDLLRKPGGQ